MKKAPPRTPHPQKLRLVGRQRGRSSVGKKKTSRSLLPLYLLERSGECHSSIHPSETFREELFQNCPAATSNTGQRTPVTVRKMKRKRPEPSVGFRPFPALRAPLAGEPSHPSIRRRSLPAWRVPRSHGGFAWASASSTMNRQPPHSKISPFSGTCPASRHR